MLPTAYDITNNVIFMTGAGRDFGKGIACPDHGVSLL